MSKKTITPLIQILPISLLSANENNPREIKHDQFERLVKSIKEFPEMLNVRPIVIDNDNIVLGGNMRLRACLEAGLTEVPTINIGHLSKEKQEEFIIKDNVSFGNWDFELLANNFDEIKLTEWGVNIPNIEPTFGNSSETENNSPKTTDDNYSTFELIMLHENKLQFLETLNKVKNEFLFEKQEEALMEILRVYNKN